MVACATRLVRRHADLRCAGKYGAEKAISPTTFKAAAPRIVRGCRRGAIAARFRRSQEALARSFFFFVFCSVSSACVAHCRRRSSSSWPSMALPGIACGLVLFLWLCGASMLFSSTRSFFWKTAASLPTTLLFTARHKTSQESVLEAVGIVDKEMNQSEAPRALWLLVLDVTSTHGDASLCASVTTFSPRVDRASVPAGTTAEESASASPVRDKPRQGGPELDRPHDGLPLLYLHWHCANVAVESRPGLWATARKDILADPETLVDTGTLARERQAQGEFCRTHEETLLRCRDG